MSRKGQNISMLLTCAKNDLLTERTKISAVNLSVSPYDPKLFQATTTSGAYMNFDHPSFAFDPDEAEFKALMTAVATSAAFDRPARSTYQRFDRLSLPFFSMDDLAPLDEKRIGEHMLRPFSHKRRYHWSVCTSFYGRPVFVPEDLVYRGSSKDLLYIANNSGLAAHPEPSIAIEEAMMSRLRADACMRTWFKRLSPYIIDPTALGEEIVSRVEYWRAKDRELVISQLDNDYGEVYLAIIRGSELPYFVCGVGATIYGETNLAIMEAIGAAETNFGVFTSLGFSHPAPRIYDIRTAFDHAMYYAATERTEELSFLYAREPGKAFARPVKSYEDLLKQLDLHVCWLTQKSAIFQVARVFSDRLVPISYGYGLGHYRHRALYRNSDVVDDSNFTIPHCFYHP